MEKLTADRIGGTMDGGSKDGRVILALDQGTTSARAIVFAADGRGSGAPWMVDRRTGA